jgi:hypothetical protein
MTNIMIMRYQKEIVFVVKEKSCILIELCNIKSVFVDNAVNTEIVCVFYRTVEIKSFESITNTALQHCVNNLRRYPYRSFIYG